VPVAALVAVGLFFVADHSSSAKPTPSSASTTPPAPLPAITVSPVHRTAVADRFCPDLLAAMPYTLNGLARREVNSPGQYAIAWGAPPVIVRCGLPRPAGFVVGTGVQQIGKVQWFPPDGPTWTAVDRDVYVSVTVPDGGDAMGALTDVGAVIAKKLPARPLHPAR